MKTMKKLIAVRPTCSAPQQWRRLARAVAPLDREPRSHRHGQDAIIAEVERTRDVWSAANVYRRSPSCSPTIGYAVREVAAWWFAKRPSSQQQMAAQMVSAARGWRLDRVRNAADFLGTAKTYKALPLLRATMQRGGTLTVDAQLAIVRAADAMAHTDGNSILVAGMSDADPSVRTAAVYAWRDVLGQANVSPVEGLLGCQLASSRRSRDGDRCVSRRPRARTRSSSS